MIWIIDPEHTRLIFDATWPEEVWPTPAGALSAESLGMILNGFAVDGATLILSHDPTRTGRQALYEKIIELGWSTQPTDGAWYAISRAGVKSTLAIAEWFDDQDPLVGGYSQLPWGAGVELRMWRATTGVPYRHTPGASTTAAIRQQTRRRDIRWQLQDPASAEWWRPPTQINPLVYSGRGKPAAPLHKWDMRSAFLAAASQALLPVGRLANTGTWANPHDAAGYYRVANASALTSRLLAALKPWRKERDGSVWLTSAMARYLAETGAPLDIIDSWTAPICARILRPWAETWAQLVKHAEHPRLAETLKRGYSEAIGLMAVPRTGIYRPDWRHIIIDVQRVSMIRRMQRVHDVTGSLPVRVDTDAVWYTVGAGPLDVLDGLLGTGPNLGNMRYEGVEQ